MRLSSTTRVPRPGAERSVTASTQARMIAKPAAGLSSDGSPLPAAACRGRAAQRAALAGVGDLDPAGGAVHGRRDRVGGRGLSRVQDDVGARLGGGEQDVGDGVLVDADPAQRVTEDLAHDGNAQQFPLEHEAEPDLRPGHPLRGCPGR